MVIIITPQCYNTHLKLQLNGITSKNNDSNNVTAVDNIRDMLLKYGISEMYTYVCARWVFSSWIKKKKFFLNNLYVGNTD